MSEATKTLSTNLAELKMNRRVQAADTYFEVLERHAAPLDGDAEALIECQQILGRTDDHIEEDIHLVQEIRRCEQLAATLPAAQAEEQRTNVEHGAVVTWCAVELKKLQDEHERRYAKSQAALSQAVAKRTAAKDAKADLPLLFDKVQAVVTGLDVETVRRERIKAGMPEHSIHGPSRVSMDRHDGHIPHGSRGFVSTAAPSTKPGGNPTTH